MHKFLATAALAFLLAGPAVAQDVNRVPAGDGEIQNDLQWQKLVAQANAHRAAILAGNTQPSARSVMSEPTAKSAANTKPASSSTAADQLSE